MANSESMAVQVLVDLEMQRNQLRQVDDMVMETTTFTQRTQKLLREMLNKANRKRVSCIFNEFLMYTIGDFIRDYSDTRDSRYCSVL